MTSTGQHHLLPLVLCEVGEGGHSRSVPPHRHDVSRDADLQANAVRREEITSSIQLLFHFDSEHQHRGAAQLCPPCGNKTCNECSN